MSPINPSSSRSSNDTQRVQQQTIVESGSTRIEPGQGDSAAVESAQAPRPASPSQYKPSLRTTFKGITPFTMYYVNGLPWSKPEKMPPLDLTIRRKESIDNLPYATPIAVDGTFRVLPFRTEGSPLVIRSREVNVPLLTSKVSDGCCVWLCVTNDAGTRGMHSLCQINSNTTDGVLAVKEETTDLQALGFTKLVSARVAGAFRRTLSTSEKAPEGACNAARALVKCLSDLGYESVTDLTRENFPDHMDSDRTMGGNMIEQDGLAVFVPIEWGIFEGKVQRLGARQQLGWARDPDRLI